MYFLQTIGDKIYEVGTEKEVFIVEGKEIIMNAGYVYIWIKVNGYWMVSQMILPPAPE